MICQVIRCVRYEAEERAKQNGSPPRARLQAWANDKDEHSCYKNQVKRDCYGPIRCRAEQEFQLLLVEAVCNQAEPYQVDGEETNKHRSVDFEVIQDAILFKFWQMTGQGLIHRVGP